MKIATEVNRNEYDREIYLKGQEFLEWNKVGLGRFGLALDDESHFEIECAKIDDKLITSANIFKNTLTLYDGAKVKGLHFKLYPLNHKDERVEHYFISYTGNCRVIKKNDIDDVDLYAEEKK